MNNIFNKVKDAIENAIDNGYNPLALKARELAEDIVEKAGDFAEESIEAVTEAVEQVKRQFDSEDSKDE
jgi:hypothetical protein